MKHTTNIFGSIPKTYKRIKFQVFAVLLLIITSCNYSDPSIETLASYNFYYYNSGQISVGGEYLKDSIYVQVYNQQSPNYVNDFTVKFEVIKGGGKVDQEVVKTNKKGKAATRWKLGNESYLQIVTAKVTDPEGRVFPQSQMSAYGMITNSWNEIASHPLNQLRDLAADTITHQSWAICSNYIYKRGANSLDWQSLPNQPNVNSKDIEVDKDGKIYIGTWNGELYKSSDHGQTWIKCTNPIRNRSNYFNFWITADGDLWATSYEDGLWHSNDQGTSWTNPTNGADKNYSIYGMFRLKNNWLVSLIAPTGLGLSVMKSEDDGKTWMALTTPNYPYSLFVTDKDEIFVFTQSNGGIYKSSDFGNTYKLVSSNPIEFNTISSQNNVQKFDQNYFVLIPGFGTLKTKDFEHFDGLSGEPYVNGIYIDHTGSIFTKGTLNKLYNSYVYIPK
jgi:hypothetical protein